MISESTAWSVARTLALCLPAAALLLGLTAGEARFGRGGTLAAEAAPVRVWSLVWFVR